jgi:hypothetical protein
MPEEKQQLEFYEIADKYIEKLKILEPRYVMLLRVTILLKPH